MADLVLLYSCLSTWHLLRPGVWVVATLVNPLSRCLPLLQKPADSPSSPGRDRKTRPGFSIPQPGSCQIGQWSWKAQQRAEGHGRTQEPPSPSSITHRGRQKATVMPSPQRCLSHEPRQQTQDIAVSRVYTGVGHERAEGTGPEPCVLYSQPCPWQLGWMPHKAPTFPESLSSACAWHRLALASVCGLSKQVASTQYLVSSCEKQVHRGPQLGILVLARQHYLPTH